MPLAVRSQALTHTVDTSRSESCNTLMDNKHMDINDALS